MNVKMARRAVRSVAGAALVALALALLFGGSPSEAAPQVRKNLKLSGDMQPLGDIDGYSVEISPDSRHVVYRADAETDEAYELYSVPSTGLEPPQRISGLLASGSMVGEFKITPNSERVVYIAPQQTADVYELFAVLIDGGPATKLNGALVAEGDVVHFALTPDGERVVYRADQDTDDVMELYVVGIGGGAVTKLSGPLVAGGDVEGFAISPDGGWVAYSADQDTDGVMELYSVPISGGVPTKLNGPLVAGGNVLPAPFYIAFGGGRVVYLADQLTDGYPELFSAPIGGGPAVRLNGPLREFNHVGDFLVAPDGERVVYQRVAGLYSLDIYSVPIDGSKNADIINHSDPGVIFPFLISPDSQRVVYEANATPFDNAMWGLFSAPITGPGFVELSGPFPAVNNSIQGATISSDSLYVFYLADQQTANVLEFYRVPITGGDHVKLNGPMAAGGDIDEFALSANGQRAVYLGDQQTDEVKELYSVPSGGGMATKVNNALVAGGDVLAFTISPDSRRVVYLADQETDEQFELFVTYDDSLLTPSPTATPTTTPTATATTTPTATTTSAAPTATPTLPAGPASPRVYVPVALKR